MSSKHASTLIPNCRNRIPQIWFGGMLVVAGISLNAVGAELDFSRDVRPILADKCFRCHGPDEDAREAELRLDNREGLFADRDGQFVVRPGAPDHSELIARIEATDPEVMMPPPNAKKPLSKNERRILRQWIAEGAAWSRHWAFRPPNRPRIPQAGKEWATNPVDHFIAAKLHQANLKPSPQADAITLVRRLYLDLIGLPPTPQAADRWAAKLSQGGEFQLGAWEQLIDELLKSPEYGPRWARRWLDLARYADTNGYEKDRDRSIWPYRDWVIRAINNDMPFDQFTIEQLAGDLLPNATLQQKIATGFHRNTMLNEEGGIDPLEFRYHAMTDRVATTGVTWLGLTVGCAQCHTHKYDPISHREYYQMMAFLNNADEPYLELPSLLQQDRYAKSKAEAEQRLNQLKQKWPQGEKQFDDEFAKWWKANRKKTVWTRLRAKTLRSNLPHLVNQPDDSVFASGDSAKHDTFFLSYDSIPASISAIRLEALPDARLPARGPGMTYYEGTIGDFFLGEIRFNFDGKPAKIRDAAHSYAKNRYGNDRNPVSAKLALDGDLQTGWSVHDRQGERHTAVFLLDDPVKRANLLEIRMDFGRHFGSALGRFRISVCNEDAPRARDLPSEVESVLELGEVELSDEQRRVLERAFLLQAPQVKQHAAAIRKLMKRPKFDTTLVMAERPVDNPRPTHIHHRGEYLQPKEKVEAGVLGFLHAFEASLPRNRLGFARWLVSKKNPLTSRVTVNRHWAAFFGRGIVPTLGDFGLQGQPPTHPQLLDWLAIEFTDNGWSVKRLHKLIVMSSAYRQSSNVSPQQLAQDPQNTWWGRSTRFRLDAEVIRDSSLFASGRISLKPYGPPVRPPQPTGVTEAAYGRPKWRASEGEDRFRRSIYTFSKRTAPFAMYNTFDSPTGESCTAKRNRSNTALQALTLLNDLMFFEVAQATADELITNRWQRAEPVNKLPSESNEESNVASAARDRELAGILFRRLLTRAPTTQEQAMVLEFVENQRKRLASGELDPAKVASKNKPKVLERAVWTLTARAIFALDEFLTRN